MKDSMQLAIQTGVAELEALVDQREVRHQIARHRHRHQRPVGERGRAYAVALDAPVRINQDGVHVGPAWRLDGAQTHLVGFKWTKRGVDRTVRWMSEQLLKQTKRHNCFGQALSQPRLDIACPVDGYVQCVVQVSIRGVWSVASQIDIHPG